MDKRLDKRLDNSVVSLDFILLFHDLNLCQTLKLLNVVWHFFRLLSGELPTCSANVLYYIFH